MQLSHEDAVRKFRTALTAYRAPDTVDLRCYYVQRIINWTEAQDMTVWDLDLQDFLTWLSSDVGPSPWTKRSAKSSISVFYQWAHATELIHENPAQKLPSLRAPQSFPNPAPEDKVEQALSRCTRRIDVLMILLGEYQGLRAGEMAPLHSADVYGEELRVVGKGNKYRMLPLHPLVSDTLRLFPTGYYFPSTRNPRGHMLAASVGRRVRWLFGNQPRINAHSLRHKFAMDAYEENPDLLALKEALGHESVATTEIYARASTKKIRKLVHALPEKESRRTALTSLSKAA
ncbi:tyrosine-type recombinase/integrase [Nesterenkonia alkaliphila]|uniref:Tyrosine-type recombinase/integrase n=1 Tax=Nesterenkonia alkaliphila TaxID=1463631 RepID=A0A7K1ULF3_9MICC|nr:tyrosine-type recombinase/integrase [Nesterenkonia alkaliphila]MVT27289.1 tyrosine-type recombinase/integrase [Nesterenkonia alkaliphila]GFZ82326.1 integrase [Nesterenkonia alkaliphila]